MSRARSDRARLLRFGFAGPDRARGTEGIGHVAAGTAHDRPGPRTAARLILRVRALAQIRSSAGADFPLVQGAGS
jgi:hypothetical protein